MFHGLGKLIIWLWKSFEISLKEFVRTLAIYNIIYCTKEIRSVFGPKSNVALHAPYHINETWQWSDTGYIWSFV